MKAWAGHAGRTTGSLLWLALGLVASGPCSFAQEALEGASQEPPPEQVAPPEPSREQWRERVARTRQRAQEAAIEQRKNPQAFVSPPPEDPERVASERIVNDESLQYGDIVSTKNGLFMFQGRGDRERRDGDFVPVPRR